MKKIFLSLLLCLMILPSAFAIDAHTIETLKKQGFQVRMGELTGAGGKMSIVNLAGLIHPKGIVMKADCKNIIVRGNQSEALISDITKVTVDQSVLNASEFEGFFTFQ